jgi:hypothetical protein
MRFFDGPGLGEEGMRESKTAACSSSSSSKRLVLVG